MAPTTGASTSQDTETTHSAPDSEEAHTQDTYALAPLAPAGFPSPAEVSAQLKKRIDNLLTGIRRERGVITCPEDTHNAIRQLADWYARSDDYSSAFAAVKTHIEGACEEELLDAVGAKRGTVDTPARLMTVPADGMNITLSPVYDTTRDIDMNQVLIGLANLVSDEWDDADELHSPAGVVAFAVEVAKRAVALYRKTDPSIRAVEALAATAGARGDDSTAAVVNSAVRETSRTYRNRVKVEIKPAA
jgi:hypothetical protein